MKLSDTNRSRCADERAVSPVIGVILMVAITVILAAVIGTFVLDLGQSAGQSAPQASLSIEADNATNQITIEHTGGDAIDQANTKIIVEWNPTITFTSASSSATMAVGGSITIDTDAGGSGTPTLTGDLGGMTTSHGTTEKFSTGDQITVTIIDTQSQRQIFETTVTA